MNLLTVNQIDKSYEEYRVLDGMSLSIQEGEIYGLLGPNGAGKSTLLKIISGLLSFDRGDIKIGAFSLLDQPLEYKKLIGYVPDHPFLYNYLTAREYLDFISGLWGINEKGLIEGVLSTVRLAERGDTLITTYSHGMKQKLSLAAALLTKPRILILDEPLTGFDPPSAKFMKDFLREYVKARNSVLVTTHILEVAQHFCDRVGIIGEGKLVQELDQLGAFDSFEDLVISVMEESA
ncbi:ABC transporter ATP-binding protein [Thermoactinomyces sp. DSM 45892]|uniref:ABC transporter ATP-binding protein n=1 Tax=Thermoactinomyces sp. DSM 45892 TaxID=1882753 RepID=UPI000899C480|nr:ABC transporter ATP-binding protein [Thermoactinomyces sp. DSM 45892]SDY72458.1 ABC-2 type transport system ATP-binding protein [Thermoactinomyces sp. DSM 45892]